MAAKMTTNNSILSLINHYAQNCFETGVARSHGFGSLTIYKEFSMEGKSFRSRVMFIYVEDLEKKLS